MFAWSNTDVNADKEKKVSRVGKKKKNDVIIRTVDRRAENELPFKRCVDFESERKLQLCTSSVCFAQYIVCDYDKARFLFDIS